MLPILVLFNFLGGASSASPVVSPVAATFSDPTRSLTVSETARTLTFTDSTRTLTITP